MSPMIKKIIFIIAVLSIFLGSFNLSYAADPVSTGLSITNRALSLLNMLQNPIASMVSGGASTVSNVANGALLGQGGLPSIYSGFGSAVLELSALLFNKSIYLGVYKISSILTSDGVKTAWKICRDIANIFFVFIILYIAIKTVLGETSSQKLITQVIIAALIVNFSAVIPRTIIDVSNMFAITFYENLGPALSNTSPERDVVQGFIKSASASYVPQSKFWAVVKTVVNTASVSHNFNPLNYLPGTLMFILAYILFVGAILFILRIVVLIIVLVVSPLAVVGWIVPKTATYSKQWLDKIVNEAIFAPLFLFLIYLSTLILQNSNLTNLDGTNSAISQLVTFIIVCSLLLVSLYISKKFSGDGASYALSWGKSAKSWFMGATVGTAGAYGLGKLANKAATSDTIKNFSAKNPFIGGFVRERLDKLADYKFAGGASYKDRVSKSADRISGFKTKELRAQYLASLSETDKAAAYGKMSEREKAELHDYVDSLVASGVPTREEQKIIDAVNGNEARGKKGLAPKTGSEAWDKLEDEKERYRASQAAREARETLEDVGSTTTPPPLPADIEAAVKKLKGNAINRVDLDKILDPSVAIYLDGQQLRRMAEGSNFNSSQMMVNPPGGGGPVTLKNFILDEVGNRIGFPGLYGASTSGPAHLTAPQITAFNALDPNLRSAYKYLTGPHGQMSYS